MNIHNFMNRQLCEYQSIFGSVGSVLDHLFFTVGNGYGVDSDSGMIVNQYSTPAYMRIDEYPEMTPEVWAALMADCRKKEEGFALRRYENTEFFSNMEIPLYEGMEFSEYVDWRMTRYKQVSVDDSMFTAESLYQELVKAQQEQSEEGRWVRPYPLSGDYSDIFHLNENTPVWLVQIAVNFCQAWIRFLTDEINNNNVWMYKEPNILDDDDAFFAELYGELAEAVDIKKYEAPTRDYADMGYTTLHRDMLEVLLPKLESYLK